jgi:hypothetical protein
LTNLVDKVRGQVTRSHVFSEGASNVIGRTSAELR